MKTQITFGAGQSNFGTIMLFFICFLFSLNSHSQKPSTMLTEDWKNGNWEKTNKTFYRYDGNGYLTHELGQSFDVTWKDQYETDHENNLDGTVRQSTTQSWDASVGWVNTIRLTHTYTVAKKARIDEIQIWIDPDWMTFLKDTHYYENGDYENETNSLSQMYDFLSSSLKDQSRETYYYNLDGTLHISISQVPNSSGWVDSERKTYSYENSKLKDILTEKWNILSKIFEKVELTTSYYYDNGTQHYIVFQDWNASTGWVNTERLTYSYDTLGVDDHVIEKSLTFYPNPAQNKITIKTDNDHVGSKYLITDQLGRQFLNGTITNQETELDVAQFSAGIYFIQVGQNKNEVIKLVKN
jgi:hypothetical protein